MNKRELKKRINKDFHNITVPDVLDEVRSQPIVINDSKGVSRKFNFRLASGIGLALILMVAIFSVYSITAFDDTTYAIISLDINPSLEIEVNKNNQVISVNALNEDGEIIIVENYKRKQLEKVIDRLLDKADQEGYDNSVVLFGIDCQDEDYESQLKEKIHNHTNNYYRERNISGHPIWGENDVEGNLTEQSRYYGISRAKLSIIYQVIEKHPEYSVEELQEMNIQQLQQLLRNN